MLSAKEQYTKENSPRRLPPLPYTDEQWDSFYSNIAIGASVDISAWGAGMDETKIYSILNKALELEKNEDRSSKVKQAYIAVLVRFKKSYAARTLNPLRKIAESEEPKHAEWLLSKVDSKNFGKFAFPSNDGPLQIGGSTLT